MILTTLGAWFRRRQAPASRPRHPATGFGGCHLVRRRRSDPGSGGVLVCAGITGSGGTGSNQRARAGGGPPRPADERSCRIPPLAWLTAALDVLEAWPEPPPVPQRAPALAWRYLIFLRTACDALEAAYGQVWQQGWSTHCPLTEVPDTHFAPRPPRPPRDRLPPSSEGLSALVLGSRLPQSRSAVPLRGAGRRRGLGASGRVLARGWDRAGRAGPDRFVATRRVQGTPSVSSPCIPPPGPGATPSMVRQEPVPPAAVVPAPVMARAPPVEATPAVAGSMDDPLAAIAARRWRPGSPIRASIATAARAGGPGNFMWRPNRLPRPARP